jgi:hypothetical protein
VIAAHRQPFLRYRLQGNPCGWMVVNLSNLLRQAERKLKASACSVHSIKFIPDREFVGKPSARLSTILPFGIIRWTS